MVMCPQIFGPYIIAKNAISIAEAIIKELKTTSLVTCLEESVSVSCLPYTVNDVEDG